MGPNHQPIVPYTEQCNQLIYTHKSIQSNGKMAIAKKLDKPAFVQLGTLLRTGIRCPLMMLRIAEDGQIAVRRSLMRVAPIELAV